MDINTRYIIDTIFTWLITGLSIIGYILTIHRLKEKWIMWIILATGWAFLGIENTLLAAGVILSETVTGALGISSYILVMASLLLLFLKFIKLHNKTNAANRVKDTLIRQ
jgi:hypothetical protein